MKRIAFIMAIVLFMGFGCFAQNQWGGGLFQYGEISKEDYYYGSMWYAPDQTNSFVNNNVDPILPNLPGHGLDQNQNAPIGGDVILLVGFGMAYALKKRKD